MQVLVADLLLKNHRLREAIAAIANEDRPKTIAYVPTVHGRRNKMRTGTRHDTVFEADIDGNHSEVDGNILPARFWSEPLYKSARVANAIDGHLMAVSVHDLGNDTVTVHGMPVSAHHYGISGDLVEDLWFTSDGLLTQVKLKASDKSDLSFSIQ